MDDPILADRVRGVRYQPETYQANEKLGDTAKSAKVDVSSSNSISQKRQWTADSATTKPAANNGVTKIEPKKEVTPEKKKPHYEEEKKKPVEIAKPVEQPKPKVEEPKPVQTAPATQSSG